MPSRDLIDAFPDLFEVEREWWWNGKNYERTALAWLANFDARRAELRPLPSPSTDGRPLWEQRWRLFFLATAGLPGHAGGEERASSTIG